MRLMKRCPKCGTRLRSVKTKCEECGREFFGVRGAIYCSNACKVKAYRKRKQRGTKP